MATLDRIKAGYSELIQAAYNIIPATLHDKIRPDFLCGTDPIFAGLHEFETSVDTRSLRNTAHVAYTFHQTGISKSNRRTTVVLPDNTIGLPRDSEYTVPFMVHELAHVLHCELNFDHDAEPVTKYAKTNKYEAFAEAFTSWLLPWYTPWMRPDDKTIAYFEGLI